MDVFPDPSPALVQIYTEAHGLAPQEVEQLVSVPVEAAMFGLPKVERIRSTSTYGLSLVNVYFEEGTDIYWARQVLAPRLHEIEADLPPQAHESFLGPIATGLGMVYMYYLEGDGYTTMELRTLQDWLVKYELKSVPGGVPGPDHRRRRPAVPGPGRPQRPPPVRPHPLRAHGEDRGRQPECRCRLHHPGAGGVHRPEHRTGGDGGRPEEHRRGQPGRDPGLPLQRGPGGDPPGHRQGGRPGQRQG